MDERDPAEVADVLGPLERAVVIGRRRLRFAEILRAAAERDQGAEPKQLIRRLRGLEAPDQLLEHRTSFACVARYPGRDGELVCRRALEGRIAELSCESLRDGEGLDRVPAPVEQIEGGAFVEAQSADLADRKTLSVSDLFDAAERLGRFRERQRPAIAVSSSSRSLRPRSASTSSRKYEGDF